MTETIFDVIDLDNDIISYQSIELLKNIFELLNKNSEISMDDTLNIHKYLWEKLFTIELVKRDDIDVYNREFKIFYILEAIYDLWSRDQKIRTSSSTTELILNSLIGKTLISRLHKFNDSGIIFQTSLLLLKHLKLSGVRNRLEIEQTFYFNYSLVMLKHFILSIESTSREQKKISAEIIFHLVNGNTLVMNMMTKAVPKHIIEHSTMSINPKDMTKWKAQEWFNLMELLNKEFDKLDTENE